MPQVWETFLKKKNITTCYQKSTIDNKFNYP